MEFRETIPVNPDSDGYIDRGCSACSVQFKVHKDDSGNVTQCPVCSHTDAANNWPSREQMEHAKAIVVAHAKNLVGDMLADALRGNPRFTPGRKEQVRVTAAHPTAPVSPRYVCDCGLRLAMKAPPVKCPGCGEGLEGKS